MKAPRHFTDSRAARVACPQAQAFRPILRIGGSAGWYYANFFWRLRAFLDVLVGGIGFKPGRQSVDSLYVGERVDFWVVETLEPDRLLRLVAEMKLPGRAWLEFAVEPEDSGSVIRQTATFYPTGVPGILYWYLLYPVHLLIFRGMIRRIVALALEGTEMSTPGSVE